MVLSFSSVIFKSIWFCIIDNIVSISWLCHWRCIGFALTIRVAMVFAFLLAFSLAIHLFQTCYIDVYSPKKLQEAKWLDVLELFILLALESEDMLTKTVVNIINYGFVYDVDTANLYYIIIWPCYFIGYGKFHNTLLVIM